MTAAELLKNTHSFECVHGSGVKIVLTDLLMADATGQAIHVEHDVSARASQYQFRDGSHLTIFHSVVVTGETHLECH